MLDDNDDDERTKPGWWLRRAAKALAGLALVAALGGGLWFVVNGLDQAKPAPKSLQQVTLLKPPPPPPPPPPPKVEEPKVVEKKEIFEPELQKLQPPEDLPKPDQPPPSLGIDAMGDGPGDGYGLVGSPGGRSLLERGGGGQGGGSRWGWYASLIQAQIQDALQRHEKTRRASFRGTVIKLWPGTDGRIVRAELATSTGDAALDAALANEVLTGLTLRQPPPKDMPLPIVIRATARGPRPA
jgi:outer membrane biosynthesis protein TonB